MSTGARVYNILIALLFLAVFANCGGEKAKSDLAELEIIPEKPIVITGDTVDDDDNKIKAPWFEFRMRLTNGSAEKITVVAVTAEVFAQDSTGQTDVKEVSWTPAEFNFQLNEDTECKFSSFGTWDAGEGKALSLRNGNSLCSRQPKFLVGDNKKGVSGRNFRYRVRAKPLGWFGTEDQADDRFEKSLTFFTQ